MRPTSHMVRRLVRTIRRTGTAWRDLTGAVGDDRRRCGVVTCGNLRVRYTLRENWIQNALCQRMRSFVLVVQTARCADTPFVAKVPQ